MAYVVVYVVPFILVSAWVSAPTAETMMEALYVPTALVFHFPEGLVAVVLLAAIGAYLVRPRWWTGLLSFFGVGTWVSLGYLLTRAMGM